jgi:hypothetical protein
MKQYFLILSFVIFTFKLAFAQNSAFVPPSIPTSPQAEAFKKYGEYSINYQTGIPDISIPLYEINHYGYKLPLTLSYNPIPLKPGYNYDVFGRGWSLSLRSCISRSIEYAPDESTDFKLDNFATAGEPIHLDCPNFDCFKVRNFAHDKYNAVLPDGSSFDFVIDNKNGVKSFLLSTAKQYKLTCVGEISFTITDENGIKYSFEESDYLDQPGFISNVAWYLTRIDLPNSNQPILLSYGLQLKNVNFTREPTFSIGSVTNLPEGFNEFNTNMGSNTQTHPYAKAETTDSYYTYKVKLLTSVQYGNNLIVFKYRNHIPWSANEVLEYTYIEKIDFYENEQTLVKNIAFDITSNETLNDFTSTPMPLGRLNSLSLNGNIPLSPKYSFEYHSSNSMSCNGTDHWGNLNWQANNYNCVGNFNLYTQEIFDANYISGPNRCYLIQCPSRVKYLSDTFNGQPFQKIKLQNSSNLTEDERKPMSPEGHGVLKKLIHPTGGYTEFEFENHEFLTATDLDGDYISNPANRIRSKASGFRIKTLSSFTAEGLISDLKHYRYGSPFVNPTYPNSIEHTGLGKAVVDPNIYTYSNYSLWNGISYPINIEKMIIGIDDRYGPQDWEDPFFENTNCYSQEVSATNFRRLVNGRTPVVYPEVTVYYGDCLDENYLILPEKTIGKTVYKYDISGFDENNIETEFFEPLIKTGNTTFYNEKKQRYNKLNEQNDYKWDGIKYSCIKKDIFHYNYQSIKSYDDYIFINKYPNYCLGWESPNITVSSFFDYKSNDYCTLSYLRTGITTLYTQNGDSIKSTSIYDYNVTERLTSVNKDDQTTKLKYPDNFSSPIFNKMVEKNMIAPIVSSEVDYKSMTQAGNKTIFKEFQFGDQTLILPAEGYKLEIKPSGNEYSLENQILKYTKNGNPMELVTKDDVHTCYIWSYDDRYMVASIVDASYNATGDIVSGTTTFTKSKIDAITNSTTTESDYLQKLAEIRSLLPNTQVSTYTYKPLIGISTMTDTRGVTTYYEYDTFNRLKQTYIIENGEKKILQKNDYHYATQQ